MPILPTKEISYCLIQKIADLYLRNLYIDVSFPTSFSSQHAVARPFAPSLSLMTTYSKEFITYVRKSFLCLLLFPREMRGDILKIRPKDLLK